MSLYVQEEHVNATAGYRMDDSGLPQEAFTDDIGDLFRSLQREYGRCVSHVYRDRDDGAVKIGWVFQKREKYDDCDETFLLETWVTLYDREAAPDGVVIPRYQFRHHTLN